MATNLSEAAADWADLITAARAGESQALGIVFERLREYLLLTVNQQLGSEVQAKCGASDIVQRTFLDVQQDIKRFKGTSEAEFKSWLRCLVKHNLIDATRKFKETKRRDISREISIDNGEKQHALPAPVKTPSSLLRRRERDEELLRVVASLPWRKRRLLELRHWQGLEFSEIAKDLQMTEAAARKLWSRTVQSLRIELTPQHDSRPNLPR